MILKYTGYAVVVAICIAIGVAWSQGVMAKVVLSGSMEPSIHTGSVIVIAPQMSYETNDVVTFQIGKDSKVPTTHRIVSLDIVGGVPKYVTKGDANTNTDFATVRDPEILGAVLFSVPYLGFMLDFAKQPLGFLLLIGIPSLLIMLQEIQKIVGEVRRKKVAITAENTIDIL